MSEPSEPSPPGFEEIQRTELASIYAVAARARVGFAAVLGSIVLYAAFADPSPWRFAFLAVVIGSLFALGLLELRRFDRTGLSRNTLPANLLFMGAFQLSVVFATGALESPIVPAMPLFSMIAGIFLGPGPLLAAFVAMFEAAIWVFATGEIFGYLPDVNLVIFGGGVRAGHNDLHLWTSAAVLSGMTFGASFVGGRLRLGFDAMVRRALEARQDELAAHTEHARELGVLAGEIAHELKNPLASVKGLAALLARDVAARDVPGKDAERLAVLRQEVDRMQGILEEFLNFSRPLVPLSTVDADVAGLCEDVAALHEGMARDRGVGVKVEAEAPVVVRCDPRKVRQVLINLVQNALDAAPRGTVVELVPRTSADGVVVDVLDRGPGVAAEVAGRVWEPGVTTKEKGSGLGLTIARALCRQHGGDLDLVPRDGGGTDAVVRLPSVPADVARGAA